MKKHMVLALLAFSLVLAACSPQAPIPEKTPQVAAKAAELLVGVASATINPPIGIFLAGYGQDRKATGIHDDLRARAIVFDDGKTPVALVVLDLISVQYPTTQRIREAVAAKVTEIELPPERIFTQAIHTHCGPDTIGIYGAGPAQSGLDPEYMAQLVETAAEQVARAVANRQPARLVTAQTECAGWAVNDSEPEILDNSAVILQCLAADGASIATLTNFACHPTVLDGDTTEVSCDWTGYFYTRMAAGLPGEHLYLQGDIGGWIQPKTPERTFALAEQYGEDLAGKVLAALHETRPVAGTPIQTARKVFDMPQQNERFRMMTTMGLVDQNRSFSGDTVKTEVAWFAVGEAQFATHPAEAAPEYAEETRKLMDSGPKFILGLGIDHLGYFCPSRYFEDTESIPHADYLTSMSPGPQSGPSMMEALASIIP